MLTPERYRLAREIFARARELPADQWRDFLTDACGDAEVRTEVLSLLELDGRDDGFLESPALDSDAADVAAEALVEHEDADLIGREIDGYVIESLIASGGMGAVHLARQTQPERHVALKIMRAGLASSRSRRRFEDESRILARLDHPNIARVLGAGTWTDGPPFPVPWFAMEYVPDARSVTRYADERSLPVRERLRLFRQACDAVAHGHQRGVIHRDIKPSNLLVSAADDEPRTRVIDFGVARLVEPDADGAPPTSPGVLVGTLPYMSPEQCAGDEVDSRTDVYALGVVLYELVTDALPFPVTDVSNADVARSIRERQPPRPSSIRPGTPADLDAVILTALEKDPQHRYQTVNELAADVDRFLGNEPVLAARPTLIRSVRAFARRHIAATIAAVAVFAVLLVAVLVISALAVQTAQEADARRRASDRAEQVTEFLTGMIKSADPAEAQGRDITVREVLDAAATDIDSRFNDNPHLEAELRTTIADAYASLGAYNVSLDQLLQAESLQSDLPAHDRAVLNATVSVAEALIELARYDEAIERLRPALDTAIRTFGREHEVTLRAMNALGVAHAMNEDFERARPLLVRSLQLARDARGDADRDVLTQMNNYGLFLLRAGDIEGAEQWLRDAAAGRETLLGPEHPETLTSRNNLATVLEHTGDADEAIAILRDVLDVRQRILPDDHPHTLSAMNNLALLLQRSGRTDEARPLYETVLEKRLDRHGEDHPETLTSMHNLARNHQAAGRFDEAETLLRREVAAYERLLPAEHPRTLNARGDLGVLILMQGQTDAAATILADVYIKAQRALPESHWYIQKYATLMGMVLTEQERYDDAEAMLLHAHERLVELVGPAHGQTRHTRRQIVRLYELQQRDDAAAPYRD